MKKGLIASLIVLVFLLSACNESQEEEQNTFAWTTQNIEFQYPTEYNSIGNSEDTIIITKSTSYMPPPGEVMFELMILSEEASLDTATTTYSDYSQHTITPMEIGENQVNKIEYIAEVTPDFTYTVYLMENGSNIITFVPGLGHETLAETVIQSLVFL